MANFDTTRDVISEALALGERGRQLTPDTALVGGLPEFDSMAVVTLIEALEQRYDIAIDDDEISTDIFASAGSLHDFISAKLAG